MGEVRAKKIWILGDMMSSLNLLKKKKRENMNRSKHLWNKNCLKNVKVKLSITLNRQLNIIN